MSNLLQEIKNYLDSIRHNAVNAALARNANEYGVCVKIVSDCEEAILSLFQKLDREYWELREQFEQVQAKVERYKEVLEWYAHPETYKRAGNGEYVIMMDKGWNAQQALKEGES
ncbi:hypothetical protein H839_08109 [Parageobacillus genomosp. 1]|uniref:Uncharacterized protein n=1 Tax=Parageobacillus genomosp. 1 TaxID=1295642 RepID=A0ABC9VG72_9BACL|nr:hypothetical protein [Parageobacillus genomosp. 1]EZP77581.1 hypothetical protein H839_08109 [Parageobacillus genomosp. 1]